MLYKNIFPTTSRIFEVDSLGDNISETIRNEYVSHCIEDCVKDILAPYRDKFKGDNSHFNEENVELPCGPEGIIFGEDDSIAPVNKFLKCNSFIKLRGTRYESLLDANHVIAPPEEENDYMESLGLELDYAENHLDCNWIHYDNIDSESFRRVVNCYQEAADDGDLNALWCLGCAFDWHHSCSQSFVDETYGLTYHYLSLVIKKGHIASVPSLCDRMIYDGLHKDAFLLTCIGAEMKDIFSMWNLARYYLCGVIVPKDESKAIELYESILNALNGTDKNTIEFMRKNYDGIKDDDLNVLKQYTERNLSIIKSQGTSWKKYFDMETVIKYHRVHEQVMSELIELNQYDQGKYISRIKSLMSRI